MSGGLPVVLAALFGLVGVALTGYVTYRAAARKHSGLIDDTEANRLWDAAEQIRKELRDEVVTLRERIAKAEQREEECEARVLRLEERLRVLERNA